MSVRICNGSICGYPGGGCWGVSTGSFSLGNFEMVQIRTLESVTDARLKELTAEAGQQAFEFLKRLRAIPGIGSYAMLSPSTFTFSMNDHRNAAPGAMKELWKKVSAEFCDVYGFTEIKLA